MNVQLYTFSKRKNSTKQPIVSDAVNVVCQLKDESNILNPILIFNPESDFMPKPFTPIYNYAYIVQWARYYFIDDWKWINGRWACYLSEDVLASFKTSIGITNAFVERSSNTYDGNIIDAFYPAKVNYSITKTSLQFSYLNVAPSGGTFVLGVINSEDTNKIGAITYYALNKDQLGSLLDFLFSDAIYNASSISDVTNGLFKSLFNPFQYIVSCMWFPFAKSSFGISTANIKLGYWDTLITADIISGIAQTTYVTATIPNHPQATSRGAYLNRAPYTECSIFIPPFGEIPIDTAFITIGRYLYSGITIDHVTGQAVLRVSLSPSSSNRDADKIITERTAMIGVPIQLTQINNDFLSNLGNFANSAMSFLTKGNITGVISAIETTAPKQCSLGVNGSFVETILTGVLITKHALLTEENNAIFGRPLMQSKTINTIPGFIKTGATTYAFSGLDSENEQINSIMQAGFFYE